MTLSGRPIVVIGAGGHGRELRDIIEACSASDGWSFTGFLDDGATVGERPFGRVLGPISLLHEMGGSYVIGIGDPKARDRIAQELATAAAQPATLVHPAATVGSRTELGPGVVIGPGSRVTTDAVIGDHTHLHSNVVVAHDCRLGNAITVTPAAALSGAVTVGDRCWLGVGSTINQNLTVGHDVRIGAGAVVIDDVESGLTVAGVPARPI